MRRSQKPSEIIYEYYLLYRKRAFQVAYALLKDSLLAQDIAQDVFVELLEKFETLDLTDEYKTLALICRIAKNKSIDKIRRSVKEEELYEQIGQLAEETPPKEIELVDAILEEMPQREADLLRCKYMIGYSNREIAEKFGIRESSVAKTLQRAKQSFQAYYLKEIENDEKS